MKIMFLYLAQQEIDLKNDLVKKKIRATGGLGWHTDARYLQGKKNESFS